MAQLDSSVPDLAATLTTQAEQDAEDDNISFLRTEFPEEDDRPTYDEAVESRRRMRRAVDSLVEPRVYTPAQLQELGELQEVSSVNPPSLMQPQYNGWAPGISEDDDDEESYTSRVPDAPQSSAALLDERVMRRDEHLRDRMRLRRLRDATQTDWRTSTYRDQPRMVENRNDDMPAITESSLRTTALLQAVRQNPQFSQRSRNELQRYILDRERGDDRDHTASTRTNEPSNPGLSPSQMRQIRREVTMRHEIQQHRDMYAENLQHRNILDEQLRQQRNTLVPPSDNTRRRRYWQTTACTEKSRINDAIKYLGRLRLCESDQEAQETAEDGGFNSNDRSSSNPRDFVLNTQLVPPPPYSSWLKAGGVLSGTQHGSSANAQLSRGPMMPSSAYRTRTRNPQFGSVPRTTSPTRPFAESTTDPIPPIQPQREEERWPVKVTIQSVNYDEMTLTGTMEAFNVPDKSSPTKVTSITTFLEGEIIDFNTFSLETKSYKADARVDGQHWRELPPFKALSDDEAVVRRLLSIGWLREELMQKWILMRWKGMCPLHLLNCDHLLITP